MTHYEDQVLRQNQQRQGARQSAGGLRPFLLWQAGGVVAIALCSRNQTLDVETLQVLYAATVVLIGGLETMQRQEWAIGILIGLGMIASIFWPEAAACMWFYGLLLYCQQPRVMPVLVGWFALATLARSYFL